MMRGLAIILLAVAPLISREVLSRDACLHFEPELGAITGTLVRQTFPGPPNYKDITKGDQPETYLLIKLEAPVCVAGTPGSDLNSRDVPSIRLIQLAFSKPEAITHERLVGRRVKAVGTLFTAHTGHHRTDVVLAVSKLDEVK